MTETFDDGTRVNGDHAGLHYSEKGGHFLRGLYKRVLGMREHLLVPPVRIETS